MGMRKAVDKTTVAQVLSLPPNPKSVDCERCFDTGTILVPGRGARSCICVKRATRKARLALVPPQFNSPRLYRLKADKKRHPGQANAIAALQENPQGSFLLLGKNFTGKSHLAWAL